MQSGMEENPEQISFTLYNAIKHIISDDLLSRARNADNQGVELWRALHAEWKGTSRQVVEAKAVRFQDPPRCLTMEELWEALPAWKALGRNVTAARYVLPEWVRVSALGKIIPTKLNEEMVGNINLTSFEKKLTFVLAGRNAGPASKHS